jgi:hypothetical protein
MRVAEEQSFFDCGSWFIDSELDMRLLYDLSWGTAQSVVLMLQLAPYKQLEIDHDKYNCDAHLRLEVTTF